MASPLRALANPLALTTLAVGGGAAVALHSLPLGAVGALTYVALVAWDLLAAAANPAAVAPAPPAIPDPSTVADPDVRDAVIGILEARTEREAALADTPDSVRSHLGSALSSCADLERNAATLVFRAEDLHRWLSTHDGAATREEQRRLAALAEKTRDPAARADYQRAQEALREQIRAVDDVTAARDRICAHLSRIAATLGSIPAKLVRMRALDAEAMDLVGEEVARDLSNLDTEVQLFEQTLHSLNQGSS